LEEKRLKPPSARDTVRAVKMHTDEIDIDASLVRRLLANQFPQWANLPIEPVPSAGTDNALYRLGADLAARLPRTAWAVGQVEKDQQWLPRLAPHLPLTVPAPLAHGLPGEGYPWTWGVYRWLDGAEADRQADSSAVATDLARFLLALQGIDATDGPSPGGRGGPLAKRDRDTRAAIAELGGEVDIDAVTAEWEAALAVPPWPGPPVWVHDDLAPGNLLVTHGRLSAVIDFAALSVGDPACDLLVAWNLFTGDARATFRAALQVDDDTWARGRGWALSVALIQLPYYLHTNPRLVASARHVISEITAPRAPEAPRRTPTRPRPSSR
jgi:aminoglycoside phosphotransferase (APT) family kinase protein